MINNFFCISFLLFTECSFYKKRSIHKLEQEVIKVETIMSANYDIIKRLERKAFVDREYNDAICFSIGHDSNTFTYEKINKNDVIKFSLKDVLKDADCFDRTDLLSIQYEYLQLYQDVSQNVMFPFLNEIKSIIDFICFQVNPALRYHKIDKYFMIKTCGTYGKIDYEDIYLNETSFRDIVMLFRMMKQNDYCHNETYRNENYFHFENYCNKLSSKINIKNARNQNLRRLIVGTFLKWLVKINK